MDNYPSQIGGFTMRERRNKVYRCIVCLEIVTGVEIKTSVTDEMATNIIHFWPETNCARYLFTPASLEESIGRHIYIEK